MPNQNLRFRYLRYYKVLVCEEHATGVQNLETHLREHHTLSREQRQDLIARFGSLERDTPAHVKLPAPGRPPLPILGTPLNAYRCRTRGCNFLTISKPKLQRHGKSAHKEPWKGDVSRRFDKVHVQSFFRTGGQQRYFIVSGEESASSTTPVLPQTQRIIDQRLAQWKAMQQLHEEEAQVMEAEAAKTDKTGWFKRTGWLEHLANRNLAHLAHQLRLPDANERKIALAAQLTQKLVARSVHGLRTLGRETRRWLRSAKQSEIDPRPMSRLQNPESEARYTSYMVKMVCYVLRVLADEEKRKGSSDNDLDDSTTDASTTDASTSDSDGDSEPGQQPNPRRPVDTMKDARELFPWQETQKDLAMELWDLLEDGHTEEDQLATLLNLLASFIFQQTGDQPFRSGLMHFTAVLGIDRDMNRLRTAKHYSNMLAGVVYCMRVLAAEAVMPSPQREGMSDEAMDERREAFLTLRRQFLADGSYSPMSECLSLLAYGKSVALATGNAGSTSWSADRQTFYLHGRAIHLHRFRTMAQDLLTTTETMMWEELLWAPHSTDRFTVPLQKIVDDVTFTRRGQSFVNHPDNGLAEGLQYMLQQVERLSEARTLQQSNGEWSVRGVKHFLRKIDQFLELLLACKHIMSGQPGRGSEILTLRHRNGLLQDRNIFVQDGQVMTIVRYHKSLSQWDKPKVIPRFLPPRLSQVIVVYLAYLQPFREYLVVQVLQGGFSDYLWAGNQGPWETDRLTRVLRRETGKRLGVALSTLDYRHTAVGLGRVVVGESFARGYQDGQGEGEVVDEEEEEEDILELQNARTTLMGTGNYGVRADIVQDISVRSINAFRSLSTAWHRFLGVGQHGTRQVKQVSDAALSAGQSPQTHIQRQKGVTVQARVPQQHLLPRKRTQVDDSRALRYQVQQAMQQALGQETVEFQSPEQEEAIYAVLRAQSPLVVVLPTGGGKSLLFTVPACLDRDDMTAVVVPYRALINKTVEQIRQRGIDCREWKYGERKPASVIVVSADLAGDVTSPGNFIGYAHMMHSAGYLRRIVIDECHLTFTSSDWRPKLRLLRNLRLVPCAIVLLTATLPPTREAHLLESMQIPTAMYIRASTVRPRTRYAVSWCKQGKVQASALALCRRNTPRLLDQGLKGIVYGGSREQCETIAQALSCPYYHAHDLEREEHLQEWLQHGGWIVATSSLGTGVDFPGIVFIMHVGMPWSMIDYAQETGRGGRSGELVNAVVVVERTQVQRAMKSKPGDLDVQAMGVFLLGDGCRRGRMSSYLDGQHISCQDSKSVKCDACGEGADDVQEEQKRWAEEQQILFDMLGDLREACGLCSLLDDVPDRWRQHTAMRCPGRNGISVTQLDRFRAMMRDGQGTHSCRRCWVSQKYCATGQDVANKCQWPNTVVPIVRAAAENEMGVRLIRMMGFQGGLLPTVESEYAQWLGRRYAQPVWGEFFSNAMVLAIAVLTAKYKQAHPEPLRRD